MIVKLDAELILELSVDCDEALEVGETYSGSFRAIPITGGTFKGNLLNGTVVPGGADWNNRYVNPQSGEVESSYVFAKYMIKTDDGEYIAIENSGTKTWEKGKETYIVTTPNFLVGKGKYEWLNYGVYVGTLKPREDKSGVEIKIFKMM